MKEFFFEHAEIIENKSISREIFSMKIRMGDLKNARAGQFVMVYLEKGEMLLPRPISICDIDSNTLEIVYQVVGKGTKVMSEMLPGQCLKILGPLGNGFKIETGQRVALVGGGIGVPPLFLLAKTLVANGMKVNAYLGFRTAPILAERFQTVAENVFIATEDGSVGHRGFITEILQSSNEKYDEIFACGPLPLLRALAEFSQATEIPCQVCMEERMACGLGTCVGCVVRVGESYVRICTEGPVFSANEVNWNE
ncbi:MAG: dihydroorotate dehydrogenase electron transfer subunit [Defluviitaleaceae bacterium]|nr:dihydroorotate dehydrogenase electron transfer subunit [Defluviitaleaceae bacterium]